MTSEEYVNQVNRLMDLQNTYLGIFLTVLSISLAIFVFFQWRLSDKQIQKIKDDITNKHKDELDKATQKMEKDFLFLSEEIIFNSIDSMLHTDLRIGHLPYRIARLLSLLRNIESIDKYRTSMLTYCVKRTMTILEGPGDSITDVSKVDFGAVIDSLDYIISFIDDKAEIDDLLELNYQNIKKDFSKFKEKYTEESDKD